MCFRIDDFQPLDLGEMVIMGDEKGVTVFDGAAGLKGIFEISCYVAIKPADVILIPTSAFTR